MYYNDNGEIKPINVKASDTLPIGTIVGYSSLNAPSGWLICDGSEVSRTIYSKLFEVIGTTYGSGDGSTTFNLPNYKGKVGVGYNSSETEFNTLGKTGGEKTHTLSGSEIPQHSHQMPMQAGNDTIERQYNASWLDNQKGNQGDVNPTGIRTSVYGGNQPHNNLQPYIVQTYIIKYEQSVGMIGNVKNESVTSSQDTYSCDYINKLNTYSTEEIKTGSTWYNGKPIYRKVLYIPNVVGNQTINVNVSNLDELFICDDKSYIYPQEYGNRLPLNFYGGGDAWTATYSEGSSIKMLFGNTYKDKHLYIKITIEYTKTTD